MRRIFLLLSCAITFLHATSQEKLLLAGKDSSQYNNFFEQINAKNKQALEDLSNSWYCFVLFRIDDQLRAVDFSITENPDNPVPEKVKQYITSIFKSADGYWQKTGERRLWTLSEPIFYSVQIRKSNQSFQGILDDTHKMADFRLFDLPKDPRFGPDVRARQLDISFSY